MESKLNEKNSELVRLLQNTYQNWTGYYILPPSKEIRPEFPEKIHSLSESNQSLLNQIQTQIFHHEPPRCKSVLNLIKLQNSSTTSDPYLKDTLNFKVQQICTNIQAPTQQRFKHLNSKMLTCKYMRLRMQKDAKYPNQGIMT